MKRRLCSSEIPVTEHQTAKLLRRRDSMIRSSDVNWSNLPDEVIHTTFLFLETTEFRAFSCVDRRNYSISKRPVLWQELCQLNLRNKRSSRCKFHRRTNPLSFPRNLLFTNYNKDVKMRISDKTSEWKAFFVYHMDIFNPRDREEEEMRIRKFLDEQESSESSSSE